MAIYRFFVADVDDAERIAFVECKRPDDFDEIPEAHGEEINPDDLPRDYAHWRQYTAHAYRDGIVRIMSRDGQ